MRADNSAARQGLKAFEASVGGRDALVNALAIAELEPKQVMFLRMLSDPKRAVDSLATICADAQLHPNELIKMFRDASFAKGHAIAVGRIATHLPSVAQDVIDKAYDQVIDCPICKGQEGVDACPECHGRGRILRKADFDRQKMVFEAAGLTQKKGGINVNVGVQNNLGAFTPGASFSKFVQGSDSDAYSVNGMDFADGEVVEG